MGKVLKKNIADWGIELAPAASAKAFFRIKTLAVPVVNRCTKDNWQTDVIGICPLSFTESRND